MRCTQISSSLISGAIVAALVTSAGTSNAQSAGLALDRFEPAPAGDRMFGVQSPYVAGALTPRVMLLADYAHNPLVLRSKSSGDSAGTVVSSQLFFHLNGSLALWNRVGVNVDVPVALYQRGESPTVGAQAFSSPSGADFGDLRLGLRVRLLGEYEDAVQVAVGGYVWLPSAPSQGFVGTGRARGLPQLILGGRADRLVWSAAAGPELERAQTFGGTAQGAMFVWGAGFGVRLLESRRLQVGPELEGGVSLRNVDAHNTNAELLLDARYRVVEDVEIGLAAGPGLSSGIGTPDFRGVLMLAYSPEPKRAIDRDQDGVLDDDDACVDVPGIHTDDPKTNGCPPPKDRDQDGVLDDDDACIDVPGVHTEDAKTNGCPPPKDRDHDGVLDGDDACVDVAGIKTDDPKTNGCPPPKDRDQDGIVDAEDACPELKGVPSSDPTQNGCPGDSDHDGIRDDRDACPNEKGAPDPDPAKNGCPKSVRVTESEIFILEQVVFDTGKATIKKVSDGLLDQVANVLNEHSEIAKLEVQGHTDSRGDKQNNQKLSQQRADAVLNALTKRGISADRLTARGYGQDVPTADNDTDAGRQQNRRVNFKIIEKQPKEKR